jgi:polyhydroxybutyrate depolymerase
MKNYLHIIAICLVLAACGGQTPTTERIYRYDGKLTVDGRERTYTLNLPPSYYSGTSFPLIIAMHGGGGNSAQFESTTFLTDKANAAQFAVVYPNGTAGGQLALQTWNGGGCCGNAVAANIDDVNFMRQLITQLTTTYKLDAKRVYATGHSNGGIMSYRLACELSDRIAAIAPNAAASMTPNCAPLRAVPVLHMHSKLDTNIPITGGVGTGIAGVSFPSLATTMDLWANLDACQKPSVVTTNPGKYTHAVWSPCRATSTVELFLTEDGGHAWPGGAPGRSGSDTPSTAIDANDLLLEFFQRHRLP